MSGEQYQGKQYQDNRRDNGGQYQGNHAQGNGDGGGFYDLNHVRMSGTVERFETVATKTGTPMIRFALRCWKEWATIVAFRDLAAQTTLNRGERVEVTGRIQTTQWTDKEGTPRTGWQIVAQTIGPETGRREGQGQGQRPQGPGRNRGEGYDMDGRQRRLPGTAGTWGKERPGVMVYQDGPF